MIYGAYKLDGETCCGFYDWEEWHSATFCPDTEILTVIDLKIHGKTYENRKEDVRNKALDFQALFSEYGLPMSWGELATWENYFETAGKRYGLLAEFRENGIC